MRVLKSLIVGIGLLTLSITQSYGLGLGEIELNSGLNQPLKAKIELLVAEPDELKQLKVKLADKAAYEAAGVERIHLLNSLIFKVVAVEGDKVVIEVTTVAPVREPFLDFVVEADWPAGRLLREYTLLLDPPVYAQERTIAVTAAQTTAPSSPSDAAPPSTEASSNTKSSKSSSVTPSSTAARSTGQFTGNEYGPVKNNENLWNIAEKIRPDGSTTEQAMMGLFKMNPSAFSGNNINNLQAGYVLRVPDAATVQELNHSAAAKKARQHYSDWLTQRRIAAAASNQAPVNRAGLAAKAEPQGVKRPPADSSAQLRLVSPEEGEGGLSGTDSEGLSSTDLARVQAAEEGAAAQALQTRIKELESRLSQKERLLTLQNDALYELQQQLGSQKDLVSTTEFTGDDVANDPTTESFSDTLLSSESDGAPAAPIEVAPEETAAEEAVAAVSDAKPASSVTVTAKVDVQPEAVENNWQDLLKDTNILLLGVGVLLIIGAAVWSWVRRRQLQSSFDASEYGLMPDELKMPVGSGEAGSVQTEMADSDSFMNESRIAPDEADSDILVEETTAGFDSFESDEADIDPIAEADVYLAYRRYQQAEDLIKSALEEDPDSEPLQIKLMEIYYGSENQLAFETEAEAVFARHGGGQEVWLRIVEMGRELCPNHPLFGETGSQDTPELSSVNLENIDLDEDMNLGDLDLDNADSEAMFQNDKPAKTDDEMPAEIVTEIESHSDDLDTLLDGLGDIQELENVQGLDALAADIEDMDTPDDIDPLASLRDVNTEQKQTEEEVESGIESFAEKMDSNPLAEDRSVDSVLEGLTPLENMSAVDETIDDADSDIASLLEGLDNFSEEDYSPSATKKTDTESHNVAEEQPTEKVSSSEHFEEIPSFDKEKAQAENQAKAKTELSTENIMDFDSSEFDHSGNVIHGGASDQPELNTTAADVDLAKNTEDTDTDIDLMASLDLSGLGGDITSDDFSSDEAGTTLLSDADDMLADDIFADMDAVGTKLDLARAYIEMEDEDGARGILEEVLEEGSDDQKQEAETIMNSIIS